MASLRFPADQRFSCGQCGRCCRRGWDIAVTAAEVQAYLRTDVARLYTEDGMPSGTSPFEPAGVPGLFRIRKRADGACGFLTEDNLCRIHREHGGAAKPLTCRVFPFALHVVEPRPVLTASFACPTVAQNVGATLAEQAQELGALAREWQRAYPAHPRAVVLVPGRALPPESLDILRDALLQIVQRQAVDGRLDLRENVGRVGDLLADLTRHRVLKLTPPAFAEYLSLTARFAAQSTKPREAHHAGPVTRLLAQGLLFAVLATGAQLEDGRRAGLRMALRLRLLRLLAHLHGVAPAPRGFDRKTARGVAADVNAPDLQPIALNYMRNAVATLGTGARSVVDELGLAAGLLHAALALAAVRAGAQGATRVDRDRFVAALTETADLAHADGGGVLGGFLSTFAAGVESLYLFAEGAGSRGS